MEERCERIGVWGDYKVVYETEDCDIEEYFEGEEEDETVRDQ